MSLALNVQIAPPRTPANTTSASRAPSASAGDAPSSFDAALSTATQAHSAEQGSRKQTSRESAGSTSDSALDAAGNTNTSTPVADASADPRVAAWGAAGMFQLSNGSAEASGPSAADAVQLLAGTDESADGALPTAIAGDALVASGASATVRTSPAPVDVLHPAPVAAGATVSATALLGTAQPAGQSSSSSAAGAVASAALPVYAVLSRETGASGSAVRIASGAVSNVALSTAFDAEGGVAEPNAPVAALGVAPDGEPAEGNAARHNASGAPQSNMAANANPAAFAQAQAAPAAEPAQLRSDAQPTAAPASASPLPAAAAPAPVSSVSGATAAAAAPGVQVAQPNAPLNAQLSRPILSVVAAGDGTHTLTITVTPERLGPVTVQAVVAGDKLRLELFAPTEQAREAVRGILGDLRRDLAGTGLHTSLGLSADDAPSKQGSGQLSQQSQSGPGGQGARDALAGEQRESAQRGATHENSEQSNAERIRAAQRAAVLDVDALALDGAAVAASAHIPLDLIA